MPVHLQTEVTDALSTPNDSPGKKQQTERSPHHDSNGWNTETAQKHLQRTL
uniref:Uncharacterized protein n=1 Tax=Anguilla anguilla TaxID=7936 RepID=A0A0E9WSI8_ANGAN